MSGGTTTPNRFAALNFEGFRALAREPGLSRYERIGFPDSYRQGFEEAIFADLCRKLPALSEHGRTIVDIGPGCSDLPGFVIARCEANAHRLVLVDSPEMLERLPERPFIRPVPGMFPACMPALADLAGRVDAVICYSVLHYIYVDTNLFDFLDQALALLAPGGSLLLGDIPNVSMRKRFFSSAAGIASHRAYTASDQMPEVTFNRLEPGCIDDAVVLGLLARARAAGFHGYVVPQDPSLPMANRREDVLIARP